ncbi:glycosyl transferase [Enterobacteriaceae bacterium H20N1]|uniref:Glycosyl transferase n=1 Tax=Dryocola boscaweniae TaxID=2925397 RepID=A0A9X3ANX3_9ENTR|nr:TcdA/TcdB catalytic glycosyltransferase domain-containing protein [Dryocola boscaweniae]MCT4702546.1 glycosyl transferase [Dryocola boscaweniae]MCT4719714.1 glycosyl transferase [Dryocola boscaweniae]
MKSPLSLLRHMLKEAWQNQAKDSDIESSYNGEPEVIQTLMSLKKTLPDILHFVWIGDLQALNLEYINIWQQVNNDKIINLWLDEDCMLCHRFHILLAQHAKVVAPQDSNQKLITLQNEAFHYIYPRLDKNHTFNVLAMQFLESINVELPQYSQTASTILAKLTDRINLKSISHVFSEKFAELKKYYYYEIIIRGNFACASDIARLLILYHYGGIYIDVDTLPAIDSCFAKTKMVLRKYITSHNEYITAAMAEATLQKLSPGHECEINISTYLNKPSDIPLPIRHIINCSIREDVKKLSITDLPALGKVLCYKNLILQSAVPSLSGVYFNNVIGAFPHSKTLSIVLRTIKKRYRFLEKNNAIFTCIRAHTTHHYLARLLTYRYEAIASTGEVTLALTGPGVIVEVLLGLGYQLLKLNEDIPPYFLSIFMQNDLYGIAFFGHTLHTPEGLVSTWMK